jgi:hypothetical protein
MPLTNATENKEKNTYQFRLAPFVTYELKSATFRKTGFTGSPSIKDRSDVFEWTTFRNNFSTSS